MVNRSRSFQGSFKGAEAIIKGLLCNGEMLWLLAGSAAGQACWAGAKPRMETVTLPRCQQEVETLHMPPCTSLGSLLCPCFLPFNLLYSFSSMTWLLGSRQERRILKTFTLLLPLRISKFNEWFWFLERRANFFSRMPWRELTQYFFRGLYK